MPYRAVGKPIIVILALLLIAWGYPLIWSPEGKEVVNARQGNIVIRSGESYGILFQEYADGVILYSINEGNFLYNGGTPRYRPFVIQPLPDEECAWLWKDRGMLTKDGKHILGRNEWTEQAWGWFPPISDNCPTKHHLEGGEEG